ncbi:MAG TPA: STAS domain-containing protein [Candidatus Eremiobacteraceae bacterium]|nr:STAS domain-containing protein [Candidatus Eremiobacteraceae bacterium]
MNQKARALPYSHDDPADLIVVRDDVEGISILHVFANLDLENAGALAEEIKVFPRSRPLIVDLSKCNFIDGACVEQLARAYADRGDRFGIVVQPGSWIERVLQMVQPLRELPLATSDHEALPRFCAPKPKSKPFLSVAASL